MAGMLIWGKGFEMSPITLSSGELSETISGIGGGMKSIAWSSVEDMRRLAEQHGVSKDIWPVYPDCDIESEVPRADAERRSAALRLALERLDPRALKANDWLEFVAQILRDGNSFFVMV
jgi:hypothetical protein